MNTPSHETLCAAYLAGEDGALDALMTEVYDRLTHKAEAMLRHDRMERMLHPGDLVAEVYRTLKDQPRRFEHFEAYAAQIMRNYILQTARLHDRKKRGGGLKPVPLEGVISALDGGGDA